MSQIERWIPEGFNIVEGITGTWFYHLRTDTRGPALCGAQWVMSTEMRPTGWGYVGHLRERYCPRCESIAKGEMKP